MEKREVEVTLYRAWMALDRSLPPDLQIVYSMQASPQRSSGFQGPPVILRMHCHHLAKALFPEFNIAVINAGAKR